MAAVVVVRRLKVGGKRQPTRGRTEAGVGSRSSRQSQEQQPLTAGGAAAAEVAAKIAQ